MTAYMTRSHTSFIHTGTYGTMNVHQPPFIRTATSKTLIGTVSKTTMKINACKLRVETLNMISTSVNEGPAISTTVLVSQNSELRGRIPIILLHLLAVLNVVSLPHLAELDTVVLLLRKLHSDRIKKESASIAMQWLCIPKDN